MKRTAISLLFLLCLFTASSRKRVACVGNSITYGLLVEDREKNCYPVKLGEMLGDEYEVGNFGHSGATLLKKGHNPYMKCPEFKAALDFKPDIILIHLGLNDTDPRNWPDHKDEFLIDYVSLVDSFKNVNPDVRVIIANLSPINSTHRRFRSGTRDWRLQVRESVKDVASAVGSELIDFETPLRDRRHLLTDGLHPDARGALLLAKTAFKAITGNYGGLAMSPLYQNGMVLQRNRPLEIEGRADAGERVFLKLDGRTYVAEADNLGQWRVTTAPLKSGKTYEMAVESGGKKLLFKDVLAGEVWLASGQSNMAFTLAEDAQGKETIAGLHDPLLRFFDVKPVAYTGNYEWSDSICSIVDDLGYFKEAKWQGVDSVNAAPLSAVAYYFARQLRDSLDVPVGIISNAVGGSGAESWMSVEKIEEVAPEMLVNWRKNDYVMPWSQGRAAKNSPAGRHPYEPSYLFSAGTRKLGYFPIKGVIWYQGESNAHNIELHETLFRGLVDNWREWFRDDMLPVCFVQLSGINRPSWPSFRDSQRRLADSMENVVMAVSHDYGHPDNVHPAMKKPVGLRLAKAALANAYGKKIVWSGPSPVDAVASGGKIYLKMRYSDGLRAANGDVVKGFEVAEYDGLYSPAEVVGMEGDTLILKSDSVAIPRFVRYGWQPYTEANLVNSCGLPASTFKIATRQSINL